MAYNSGYHQSIGVSPYECMFSILSNVVASSFKGGLYVYFEDDVDDADGGNGDDDMVSDCSGNDDDDVEVGLLSFMVMILIMMIMILFKVVALKWHWLCRRQSEICWSCSQKS